MGVALARSSSLFVVVIMAFLLTPKRTAGRPATDINQWRRNIMAFSPQGYSLVTK
jgi:hypothetical protein